MKFLKKKSVLPNCYKNKLIFISQQSSYENNLISNMDLSNLNN